MQPKRQSKPSTPADSFKRNEDFMVAFIAPSKNSSTELAL